MIRTLKWVSILLLLFVTFMLGAGVVGCLFAGVSVVWGSR